MEIKKIEDMCKLCVTINSEIGWNCNYCFIYRLSQMKYEISNEFSISNTVKDKKEQTCLTCEFEPNWRKINFDVEAIGTCQWDCKSIKIPPCFTLKRDFGSVIFKSNPIKNCPVWKSKRI